MSAKATLESQLNNEPCEIEDTEEMFWLRESDDCQSKIKLGNALAAQYRFRDAIDAYRRAYNIKSDNPTISLCLAGSYLTLFMFDEAKKAYDNARKAGASEKALAYPLGILSYLSGDYSEAADFFTKCLPCDGEMKIAIIYWHTLAAYKGNFSASLLSEYSETMEVGHHTAYKQAVSVFAGNISIAEVTPVNGDLNNSILKYGLSIYAKHLGDLQLSKQMLDETLSCKSMWPNVSYLAAYHDYCQAD